MDPMLRIVGRQKIESFSIGADPKMVLRIQRQRCDDVAREPVAFCKVDKFTMHKMAETMQRSNPQAAVAILCQSSDKIIGQTVCLRIRRCVAAVDLRQPMPCAHPQRAIWGRQQRANKCIRQQICCGCRGEPPMLHVIQSIGSSDPQISLGVGRERENRIACQSVLLCENRNMAAVVAVEPAAIRANPHISVRPPQNRADQVVREAIALRQRRLNFWFFSSVAPAASVPTHREPLAIFIHCQDQVLRQSLLRWEDADRAVVDARDAVIRPHPQRTFPVLDIAPGFELIPGKPFAVE